jgi:glutamyl endopeptidase
MTKKQHESLMTPSERKACKKVASTGDKPHSQRAKALLVVDAGKSEAEAATQSDLTPKKVKYWLGRFRSRRETIFPDSLLKTETPLITEMEVATSDSNRSGQNETKGQEKAVTSPAPKTKPNKKKGQNSKRRITMSNTSGKEMEATKGPEEKTYGYQGPQKPESIDDTSVVAKKQQLIGAFEQFVDSLAGTYHPGGSGGGNSPGDSPPSDTGDSGADTQGAGSDGQSSGSGQGTGGQSGQEAPSMGSGSSSERQDSEAFDSSIGVLRESYRLDRARDMAKTAEAATEAPTSIPTDKVITNKHMSVSNKAPLQAPQEFAPSYGEHGRSKLSSMEVITKPSGESGRPETAPAPPVMSDPPLDAYWASFGTAIERAQERARIAAKHKGDTKIFELIIGTDDRVNVTSNDVYPWHCICSLLITAQNGSVYIGTGWLVSPRVVLTAGHCVYLHDDGGWASQIEVIPGRNGAARPYGSVISRNLRSIRGWTLDRDRDYDYAAILLPEERRYGDELGWFGFASRTDDHFSGITLNLSGYPGDGGPTNQQGTQWWNARAVKDVNEKQITYEIDTWGGQSGSPVWEYTYEGHRYGLAIHTWGSTVSNGATRITSEVFDNIVLWTSEVP